MKRPDGIIITVGKRVEEIDGAWGDYECTYVKPDSDYEYTGYIEGDGFDFLWGELKDEDGNEVPVFEWPEPKEPDYDAPKPLTPLENYQQNDEHNVP